MSRRIVDLVPWPEPEDVAILQLMSDHVAAGRQDHHVRLRWLDDVVDFLEGGTLDVDGDVVAQVSVRVGRAYGPQVVNDLDRAGLLRADVAAEAVPGAWLMAEFPGLSLERRQWRSLFGLAGFTVDGQPAQRPADPVQLYRGSTSGQRTGWSWTPDLEQARTFATSRGRRPGKVWAMLAPPASLLAVMTGGEWGRQGETEHVVDTRGCEIVALGVEDTP